MMTRATAKLRPKAKMSGRLSSTTGLEAARRTAKRLSKLRKPASHSSRNAAVSDVHDPTYRPDPASRPRMKCIWLADEDEAVSNRHLLHPGHLRSPRGTIQAWLTPRSPRLRDNTCRALCPCFLVSAMDFRSVFADSVPQHHDPARLFVRGHCAL